MSDDTKFWLVIIGSIGAIVVVIGGLALLLASHELKNEAAYRSQFHCDNGMILTKTITGYGAKGRVYTSGYVCAYPALRDPNVNQN